MLQNIPFDDNMDVERLIIGISVLVFPAAGRLFGKSYVVPAVVSLGVNPRPVGEEVADNHVFVGVCPDVLGEIRFHVKETFRAGGFEVVKRTVRKIDV